MDAQKHKIRMDTRIKDDTGSIKFTVLKISDFCIVFGQVLLHVYMGLYKCLQYYIDQNEQNQGKLIRVSDKTRRHEVKT